jgi:hypothetical protein
VIFLRSDPETVATNVTESGTEYAQTGLVRKLRPESAA